MTQLKEFLSASENTTSREVMLAHRTIFDLKLAAARGDYDLRVFSPDVDRDGYDIVLEDGDSLVRVQLKATLNARASATKVHKALLRPTAYSCERLGFESSPTGIGLGGGVLQCIADSKRPDLPVRYRYADVRILTAFHWGLWNGPKADACNRIISELQTGRGKERVSLTPKMMLVPESIDALLALMGLHSTINSNWPNLLYALGKKTKGQGPRDPADCPVEQKIAIDALRELVK